MKKTKEAESADSCRLPEIDTNACKGCRCEAYCFRQMTLFEFNKKKEGIQNENQN